MDERCHWRKPALFAGERKGLLRQAPGRVPVEPAFPAEGEFLTTVRDFGKSRLIGLLARARTRVRLPESKAVRYDLLSGGIAQASYESSPERPVLLIERATRIARLTISPALEIGLADEAGAPVDLSVVRVEVFDPSGKLARHYSGNVTVRDGRAAFHIPFALSDAPGAWRVRARDVVSGLTGERVLDSSKLADSRRRGR
jgi:hypothetical protein